MAHAPLRPDRGLHRFDAGDLSSTHDRTLGGSAAVCVAVVLPGQRRLFAGAGLGGELRRDDVGVGHISLPRHADSLLGDFVCGGYGRLFPAPSYHSPPGGCGLRSLGFGAVERPCTICVSIHHPHLKTEGRLRGGHDQWMAGQFLFSSRAGQSAAICDCQKRRSFSVRFRTAGSWRYRFPWVCRSGRFALEAKRCSRRFKHRCLAIGNPSRFTVRTGGGGIACQNLSLRRNTPFCLSHRFCGGWRQLPPGQVGAATDRERNRSRPPRGRGL